MTCYVFDRVVINGNPPRDNYIFPPSLLSPQQMSKCAVGCHLWMKRKNREKTTRYSGSGVKNSRNSGKMSCVFRTEIWLLIDIRRRIVCF